MGNTFNPRNFVAKQLKDVLDTVMARTLTHVDDHMTGVARVQVSTLTMTFELGISDSKAGGFDFTKSESAAKLRYRYTANGESTVDVELIYNEGTYGGL